MGDLPGGGRKPRAATPLAWRLLYLGGLAFIAWAFNSSRTSQTAAISEMHTIHGDILKTVKDISSLNQILQEHTKQLAGVSLASDLVTLSAKVDALQEQLAKPAGPETMRETMRKDLADGLLSITGTVETVVQKQRASHESEREVKTLLDEIKQSVEASQAAQLAAQAAQAAALKSAEERIEALFQAEKRVEAQHHNTAAGAQAAALAKPEVAPAGAATHSDSQAAAAAETAVAAAEVTHHDEVPHTESATPPHEAADIETHHQVELADPGGDVAPASSVTATDVDVGVEPNPEGAATMAAAESAPVVAPVGTHAEVGVEDSSHHHDTGNHEEP